MAERAHVTSIDALDALRAKVVVFQAEASRALDEALDGIRSTRSWLELEQRQKWVGELRRRTKRLAQAEQEFFSARLGDHHSVSAARRMAVDRAKAEVRAAEEKLERIKVWARELERRTAPLAKRIDGLRARVTEDFPKAAAFLRQAGDALQAYAEAGAPEAGPAPAPSPSGQGREAQPGAGGHPDDEREAGRGG
jgi:hypothetical protein